MQVFIAEDNSYERERLRKLILSWAQIRSLDVSVTAVRNLVGIDTRDLRLCDVMFLDIELPGKDGLSFAREVRRLGCATEIVFVTSHTEFSIKGYDVHALDYMVKPVIGDRINETLDYLIKRNQLYSQESIAFQKGFSQQDTYYVNEILYVEASNHNVVVCTFDKKESYALTFSEIEQRFPRDRFRKCHRGYIVNIQAIKGLNKNTISLIDGQQILVSSTYFKDIKEALVALRGGK